MVVKKILYLNRRAPYGTSYALESLESALIAATFEQDVSLAFIDDGIYQITKKQNTSNIGIKNFSMTYKALSDYGIHKIYILKSSLLARGLTKNSLLPLMHKYDNKLEKSSIIMLSNTEFAKVLAEQDVCISC